MSEYRQHPSYGIMSISNRSVSCEKALFGSDIKHYETVYIEIAHAKAKDNDYHGTDIRKTENIVAIEMSGTQFANIITHANHGEGFPVTIKYINSEAVPEPDFEPVTDRHYRDFKERINKSNESANELINQLSQIIENKKTLTKADKEKILRLAGSIQKSIGDTTSFQMKIFEEQMDSIVNDAKSEIITYFEKNKQKAVMDAQHIPVMLEKRKDET